MAVYSITKVETEKELIVALKTKKECILIDNEDFFWETRNKVENTKSARKRKKAGTIGMLIGAASVAVPFVGWFATAAIFGGSAIFTALSDKKDMFKGYSPYLDYENHSVVLLLGTFDKNN